MAVPLWSGCHSGGGAVEVSVLRGAEGLKRVIIIILLKKELVPKGAGICIFLET